MTDASAVAQNAVTEYQNQQAAQWAAMTADALEISGGDLERGDSLVGVPFLITGLKFWRGDFQRSDIKGKNGDVVAIYVIVGPDQEIERGVRRGRIQLPLSVEAGEALVFNEAGTGVYRQMVQLAESQGFISLPEGPAEGAYGESRFDTPIDMWGWDGATVTTKGMPDETGSVADRPTLDLEIKILCPRGLRVSDYENEHTKTGHTRYIA